MSNANPVAEVAPKDVESKVISESFTSKYTTVVLRVNSQNIGLSYNRFDSAAASLVSAPVAQTILNVLSDVEVIVKNCLVGYLSRSRWRRCICKIHNFPASFEDVHAYYSICTVGLANTATERVRSSFSHLK
jgi:hypothetical protein